MKQRLILLYTSLSCVRKNRSLGKFFILQNIQSRGRKGEKKEGKKKPPKEKLAHHLVNPATSSWSPCCSPLMNLTLGEVLSVKSPLEWPIAPLQGGGAGTTQLKDGCFYTGSGSFGILPRLENHLHNAHAL